MLLVNLGTMATYVSGRLMIKKKKTVNQTNRVLFNLGIKYINIISGFLFLDFLSLLQRENPLIFDKRKEISLFFSDIYKILKILQLKKIKSNDIIELFVGDETIIVEKISNDIFILNTKLDISSI